MRLIFPIFVFLFLGVTYADAQAARVPGEIASNTDGASDTISAPTFVRANRPFRVTVTTSGNGCVTKGDASVVVGESSADIYVYDFTSATRPGSICTMIYKQFRHTVTLRIPKRGTATLRAWGRQGDTPHVIEKTITVR